MLMYEKLIKSYMNEEFYKHAFNIPVFSSLKANLATI